MTTEEIIQAISDDKMMPFIQSEQLAGIVDFVIKNYNPSLPSNLDEAANMYGLKSAHGEDNYCAWWHRDGFKAGAEWMAGRYKFDYTKGHHTAMILSKECMNDHGWFQREREIIELTEFIEKICGYNQPTK